MPNEKPPGPPQGMNVVMICGTEIGSTWTSSGTTERPDIAHFNGGGGTTAVGSSSSGTAALAQFEAASFVSRNSSAFGSTFGGTEFNGTAYDEFSFGGYVDEPVTFDDEPATGTFIETDKIIVHDNANAARHESEPPVCPPEGAATVIDLLLSPDDAESTLANLEEAYEKRVRKGRKYANVWYWAQAIRIVLERYIRLLSPLRGKA